MDDYISASELAILTGKSKQWICALIRAGRIPATKRGNTWMLDPMTRLPINGNSEHKAKRKQRLVEVAFAREHGLSLDEIEGSPWPCS